MKANIWPERFLKEKTTPQLFQGLTEETLSYILQNAAIKNFRNGQILIHQGDKPAHLFFIISGTVKTTRTDEDGHEAIIRMLQAGETCMEAVLFMETSSPISVQTISDSKLLLIPERLVKSLAIENAQFANNLLHIITHYYKSAMHQIDAMQIKTPLQRIGYYFLVKYLERGQPGTRFSLPFKKSTIATYLGMTPETFSRCLSKLREIGVDIEDEVVQLRSLSSLCHFCDSDTYAMCGRKDKTDCPQHHRSKK